MLNFSKILFIFIFCILNFASLSHTKKTSFSSSPSKWKCEDSDDELIDKMMRDAIVIGTNQSFPTNEKNLKSFCK